VIFTYLLIDMGNSVSYCEEAVVRR